MTRDSPIAKLLIGIISGLLAYIVVDYLFKGVAPAVSFSAGVLAAWVVIRS